MTGAVATLRDYASLIKLSHTVFALPFAVLALLVATGGRPGLRLSVLCVLAVLCARTSAMAYNRWADRELDASNPRTQGREIPRGLVSPRSALLLALVSGALFLAVCAVIGNGCLWLGLPVWLWLLGYSHAKRWTALCHLWLGVALGLAPLAAWFAATGSMAWPPVVLGLGVTCWVAGFDVLYACQDEGFDRQHGLHSIPSALGTGGALWAARGLHGAAVVLFAAFGVAVGLDRALLGGVAVAAGLLLWQHVQLHSRGLAWMSPFLFTANGLVSCVLLLAGCLDLYLR
jgi:4-hydroxybenzoate polyprenyltransferase